jgi:hypothetical protein
MKSIKNEIINIVISLVVTIGLYYLYMLFNQPFPTAFLVVVFMLILIYLELPKIEKKK